MPSWFVEADTCRITEMSDFNILLFGKPLLAFWLPHHHCLYLPIPPLCFSCLSSPPFFFTGRLSHFRRVSSSCAAAFTVHNFPGQRLWPEPRHSHACNHAQPHSRPSVFRLITPQSVVPSRPNSTSSLPIGYNSTPSEGMPCASNPLPFHPLSVPVVALPH